MTTFNTAIGQVEALYVGYFGRAGDPAGANYWTHNLTTGVNTIQQEAASFSVQPEAKAMYPYLANPAIADPGQFVDQVYQNLFNRPADAAGKAYWVAQLQAASGNPNAVGQFILNVISGATGDDNLTITNKVEVATHFTEVATNNNTPWTAAVQAQSQTEIAGTTSDPASVTAANDSTDSYLSLTVTVAQAQTLGSTQPYSISDTVAHETAAGAAAVLNKAVNITATDTATIAQATKIESSTNSGITKIASVSDTASAIAGSSNAVLSAVTGAVAATTAATGAQASSIAGFTKAVVYSVSDTAASVAVSTGLNEAVNVTATGVGTVAQATAISSATNTGTKSIDAVTDTAANLAASSNKVLNLAKGAVTASDSATAAQAGTLAGFTKAVVYSVSDTPENITAAAGVALNHAVNIDETGVATIAQAQVVASATNTGFKHVAAVTDTTAHIAASSNAVLNTVQGSVTASDNATAAQAGTLSAFTHAVVYNVSDAAANVAGAAGSALNKAVNITETGVATIAEAAVVASATNSGSKSVESLSDTAADIAASSSAVIGNVTGVATATTTATGAEASIIGGFQTHAGAAVAYSVVDTAANIVSATGVGLNKAINITTTDAASVAQATTIEGATNSGAKVFSISDFYTTVQSALAVGGNTTKAVNDAVSLTALGSSVADTINMGAYARGLTIEGKGGADNITGSQGNDTFLVTNLADFAVGEQVNGLAGTDTLKFTVAGTIAYNGHGVANVEQLSLTQGINNVQVYEGSGLARVDGLNTAGSFFTLTANQTAFNAAASASAAAVNTAGKWFYAAGADDGTLTYWDQVANAAVTVVLKGVETGPLAGTVASVGGNLVFQEGPSTLVANYGTTAANTLTVSGSAAGIVLVTAGGVVTNAGVNVPVTGSAFAPATVTKIDLSGVTGGAGSTIVVNGTAGNEAKLTNVTATSGDDTVVLTDSNMPSANGGRVLAINGGTGANTVVVNNVGAASTIGGGKAGVAGASTLTNIQQLQIQDGSNGTNLLTIGAVAGLAVVNTGFGASVQLGASATQSYMSNSNGNDHVTLGAAGQTITDTGAGADIDFSTVANLRGSTLNHSGPGTNALVVTDAGTVTLRDTAVAGGATGFSGLTQVQLTGASTLDITPSTDIAVFQGNGATTIDATGTAGTVTVTETAANAPLTLTGDGHFVVTDTLSNITDTGTGNLAVTASAINNITIDSSATTTVHDANLAGNSQIIDGSGSFTIDGLTDNSTVTLAASHTGATSFVLGAGTSTINSNAGNGAITIDATALDNVGFTYTGAHSATIDLSGADASGLFGGTASGALTVNTSDAAFRAITTGSGNDTITSVASGGAGGNALAINSGDGSDTVAVAGKYGAVTINGGNGADTINTSALSQGNVTITGGAGADHITLGSGGTTAVVVGTANQGTSLVTSMDTVEGFNVPTSTFKIGTAIQAGQLLTTQNVASSDTTNLAATFQNAVSAAYSANHNAWDSVGDGIQVQIAAGSAAGDYLLMHETSMAGNYNAAVDVAVKVVGIQGVLTAQHIVA